MVEVDYCEAWTLWGAGAKLEDFSMWGLPFLWWARIGKILQFAGGVAAVLDLIGPERMLRIADNLERTAKGYRSWAQRLKGKNKSALVEFLVVYAIMLPLALLFYYEVASRSSLLLLLAIPLVGFVSVGLLIAIPYVTRQSLRILSKLLTVGRHANTTRWLAFFAVAIGFHFDLLGS